MCTVTVLEAGGDRRLGFKRFASRPSPARNEVTVAVRAISLDNGEIREALAAPAGQRFYDTLLRFLDHVVDEAFLKPVHRAMLFASRDPATLIDLTGSYQLPDENEVDQLL